MASTTRFDKSALCCLRFSLRASRTVASVTKPRLIKSLPSGSPLRFCSISTMRNWSSLITPFWISNLPSGSFACSAMKRLFLSGNHDAVGCIIAGHTQCAQPRLRCRLVKRRWSCLRQGQRARVVAGSHFRLVQLVQAHGQIERIIGVVGYGAVGAEELLLRFGPAALLGVDIAQCKQHRAAVGRTG